MSHSGLRLIRLALVTEESECAMAWDPGLYRLEPSGRWEVLYVHELARLKILMSVEADRPRLRIGDYWGDVIPYQEIRSDLPGIGLIPRLITSMPVVVQCSAGCASAVSSLPGARHALQRAPPTTVL